MFSSRCQPTGNAQKCLVQNTEANQTSDFFTEKQQNDLVRAQSWGFCQKIQCSQKLKMKKRKHSPIEPFLSLNFADRGIWPHQMLTRDSGEGLVDSRLGLLYASFINSWVLPLTHAFIRLLWNVLLWQHWNTERNKADVIGVSTELKSSEDR